MQENCQKIKLLKLYEMLRQESDEQNPMTTATILRRLFAMGISCDRRTLAKDIEVLNAQGYEVMSVRLGKEKGYYVAERFFSVPELKILIDAVQAASFVTEKKTARLIEKIAALGGSHCAEILKGNMVRFNTRKHSNEAIYYNINFLEEALLQKKKAAFRYFDLDENGEKVYRKGGEHYLTEPVALVFKEDNYYLIAYSEKHDDTVNYRVDRMDRMEIAQEAVSSKALSLRDELDGYTGQMFNMYGGRKEKVVLEFDPHLAGAVYDKFGEDTKLIKSGDKCAASVEVQVSPTFLGWLFQFGAGMRVAAPATVAEEYKNRAKEVLTPSAPPR